MKKLLLSVVLLCSVGLTLASEISRTIFADNGKEKNEDMVIVIKEDPKSSTQTKHCFEVYDQKGKTFVVKFDVALLTKSPLHPGDLIIILNRKNPDALSYENQSAPSHN